MFAVMDLDESSMLSVQVVHMDMKPKNVLLTADYSIAKIADVGLAHIMGGSTPGSQAMGTFAYAAPEQLLNQSCDEKVLNAKTFLEV